MSSKSYNIYIDESCYLEHDNLPVMCIGYLKIESDKYPVIKESIKKIKLKHKAPTEIKWSKLSMSRLSLYKDLVDFFFQNNLFFRCVLIKNKQNLDHNLFNRGDHNAFYYKMVYQLLNNEKLNPTDNQYKILIDIKDTRGKERLSVLEECLCNKNNGNNPFTYFQHIRSHENELIQLTDLFIGAITYKTRKEHEKTNASVVKLEIINYIEEKTGFSIDKGTKSGEPKFNIFDFKISSSL